MPSNPSVLALFTPQPSVEPNTPKPDYGSDSDFNDYLSNAANQVDQTQKISSGDSAQNNNQNEIDQAEKSKTIKNKNNKPETFSEKYEAAANATENKSIIPAKTEKKDN